MERSWSERTGRRPSAPRRNLKMTEFYLYFTVWKNLRHEDVHANSTLMRRLPLHCWFSGRRGMMAHQ